MRQDHGVIEVDLFFEHILICIAETYNDTARRSNVGKHLGMVSERFSRDLSSTIMRQAHIPLVSEHFYRIHMD